MNGFRAKFGVEVCGHWNGKGRTRLIGQLFDRLVGYNHYDYETDRLLQIGSTLTTIILTIDDNLDDFAYARSNLIGGGTHVVTTVAVVSIRYGQRTILVWPQMAVHYDRSKIVGKLTIHSY